MDNILLLENYNEKIFDFKKLMSQKESILIKNSNNVKIILNSKINKIIIENSLNISVMLISTISGIDIEKSKNIKIYSEIPKNINYLDCYKSEVIIYLSQIKDNNNFKINSKLSKIEYLIKN